MGVVSVLCDNTLLQGYPVLSKPNLSFLLSYVDLDAENQAAVMIHLQQQGLN